MKRDVASNIYLGLELLLFIIGFVGIYLLEDITNKLLCLYLLITSSMSMREELSK